ncbi:hypothetical protein [Chondromyces apiculatus]|uniref:Uncharacterized protein n=1 Tax=Chondromyces apiculatus DSM 436 TaxID=1192034 RepID=A0A017SY61_9BACT|nr:hypothetical protein [Chondromyces apiculatus]EYF01903.1 Hypothetical protein CAP_7671 [Chondromyces apiculatus DSM 436]
MNDRVAAGALLLAVLIIRTGADGYDHAVRELRDAAWASSWGGTSGGAGASATARALVDLVKAFGPEACEGFRDVLSMEIPRELVELQAQAFRDVNASDSAAVDALPVVEGWKAALHPVWGELVSRLETDRLGDLKTLVEEEVVRRGG